MEAINALSNAPVEVGLTSLATYAEHENWADFSACVSIYGTTVSVKTRDFFFIA